MGPDLAPLEILRLDPAAARERIEELVEVLRDAVEGGASVSFLRPLARDEAARFWEGVIAAIEQGRRILLVAIDRGRAVGTVQLDLVAMPNQRHRADVAKLLVRRSARGRGIGRQLMVRIEQEALEVGRTLLTLDTIGGTAAERLYRSLGFSRAGVIPRFALSSDGRLEDTVLFFKELRTDLERL